MMPPIPQYDVGHVFFYERDAVQLRVERMLDYPLCQYDCVMLDGEFKGAHCHVDWEKI